MKFGPTIASNPTLERVLAAAIAVLLAVALFAAGVGVGRHSDDTTATTAPTSAPPPPAGGDDTTTTTTAPAAPVPDPGPAQGPVLEGSARAVAYDGNLIELASMQLRGGAELSANGEVFDETGASRGHGRLEASGATLNLSGESLGVDLDGELRLSGTTARIANPGSAFGIFKVTTNRPLTVAAPALSFTSGDQPATRLRGPVRIDLIGTADIDSMGDVEWADPPATIRLGGNQGRTSLSWAGTGVVRTPGQEHRATHLGVKANRLDATLERAGRAYRLHGDAEVLQAYADGLPKVPGRGTVRLKSRPGRVPRGGGSSFTWAPENDGSTDMVMTRIRPGNAEANWVSLGLDTLPPMCGGETCPVRGGDTAGFRKGRPISSVIIPGTGDERNITFVVPDDAALGRHQIVIVVEGNFSPIRVVVDFEVVEPPPPTTYG